MRYYVVADVHGFYTYLIEALTKTGWFSDTGEKRLVLCGDMLDRGGEAQETVQFMSELHDNGELIYISGNHEDLFFTALQSIAHGDAVDVAVSYHARNGTWDTVCQLAGMNERAAIRYPRELVRRVRQHSFYRKLLRASVDCYETEHYIFCHGWIPVISEGYRPYVKYRYDENWRKAPPEQWKAARWLNGMDMACKHHIVEDKTVVCGHWHTSYGHSVFDKRGSEFDKDSDFSPFYSKGIIALDACTAFSRQVNCIIIED